MKRFKRQSDLIKHSIKRAIHRCDVLEPEEHMERTMEHMKKNDWMQWAGQKLKGLK